MPHTPRQSRNVQDITPQGLGDPFNETARALGRTMKEYAQRSLDRYRRAQFRHEFNDPNLTRPYNHAEASIYKTRKLRDPTPIAEQAPPKAPFPGTAPWETGGDLIVPTPRYSSQPYTLTNISNIQESAQPIQPSPFASAVSSFKRNRLP